MEAETLLSTADEEGPGPTMAGCFREAHRLRGEEAEAWRGVTSTESPEQLVAEPSPRPGSLPVPCALQPPAMTCLSPWAGIGPRVQAFSTVSA